MKEIRDTKSKPRQLEGRHVLALLIAFFGVVFAVNGYFLVQALSTHAGVVAIEPYRKGLAYNQRIAANDRQVELGWKDEIVATPDGRVLVALTGPDGLALRGLLITGTIGRPATAAEDRSLAFLEEAGAYTSNSNARPTGAWIVSIEVRTASTDSEPVYRARRRLWLKS